MEKKLDVDINPVPDDPSRDTIAEAFTLEGERWHMTDEGEYQAAAAILVNKETGESEYAVILEWPARINKTTEHLTLRMAMAPDDAMGLAKVLYHSGLWLVERGKRAQ